MNYVILAAGEGSRLKSVSPKPLAEIGGKTLLSRMIDMIGDMAHTVVVANAAIPAIAASVPPGVKVLEVRTLSAAHSLHLGVIQSISEPTICITVDSYFSAASFQAFKQAFEQTDADVMMGVSSFIDDETPLYVSESHGHVTALADFEPTDVKYVSAGVYGLTPKALAIVPPAIEKGVNGLRELQRALLLKDLDIRIFDMGKVIDVDRPEDLETARKI